MFNYIRNVFFTNGLGLNPTLNRPLPAWVYHLHRLRRLAYRSSIFLTFRILDQVSLLLHLHRLWVVLNCLYNGRIDSQSVPITKVKIKFFLNDFRNYCEAT